MNRTIGLALTLAVVWVLAPEAAAQRKKHVAYTDPAEATEKDPDFALQGEYTGRVTDGDKEQPVGFQLIALGNGQFKAVRYEGGLPGHDGDEKAQKKEKKEGKAGADEEPARQGEPSKADASVPENLKALYALLNKKTQERGEKSEAQASRDGDGKLVFKHQAWQATFSPKGGHTLADANGRKLCDLTRISRQSPTLGFAPPEGVVVLFDGKNTDAWNPGRMTKDGLLMENAATKRGFQSCFVHLEFRTPYMPTARGQGRGNSGVYLQRRYEVQVLDSFGLEGRDNECGGVYKVGRPAVNMALPPLTWQTYDIFFTAARFDDTGRKTASARLTVFHNGVLIHDDIEVPKLTGGGQRSESPEPGPLYLQGHGNPVRYRNIWVVPLGD